MALAYAMFHRRYCNVLPPYISPPSPSSLAHLGSAVGTSLRLVGVYLIYVSSTGLSKRAQDAGAWGSAELRANWGILILGLSCHEDHGLGQSSPSSRKAILRIPLPSCLRSQCARICL